MINKVFKKNIIWIAIFVAFVSIGCKKEPQIVSDSVNPDLRPEIVATPEDLGISENNSIIVSEPCVYSGNTVVELSGNVPNIDKIDGKTEFETYSELDSLGRVGVAYANISTKTMPLEGEVRGEIGMMKPTGWKQNKYDCIEDRYLYNGC